MFSKSLDTAVCCWLVVRLCSEGLWMRQCVAGSLFGYVQKVSGCGSVLLARCSAMFRRSLDAAVCCWLVVRLCSEGLWMRQCVAGSLFGYVRKVSGYGSVLLYRSLGFESSGD
ncbi:uncharacterized protein LOC143911146 [Arctopsyche grandis]|uniref:uncharacterized protein LOC143911146 n=1 Tax=Arctopsyche grandis TaxID=121162 RepID=UPI00406D73A2